MKQQQEKHKTLISTVSYIKYLHYFDYFLGKWRNSCHIMLCTAQCGLQGEIKFCQNVRLLKKNETSYTKSFWKAISRTQRKVNAILISASSLNLERMTSLYFSYKATLGVCADNLCLTDVGISYKKISNADNSSFPP